MTGNRVAWENAISIPELKMSTVCAIILDYFGSGKTIACLTSLLDQGLDAVMVVDNSGDPRANLRLRSALDDFNRLGPPFTIHRIVNQHNLGYAAGVNQALGRLEENHPHEYYLLMNNDAQATPGMVRELLEHTRKNNGLKVAAPVIDMGHRQITFAWYHRFCGLVLTRHIPGAFPYLRACCLLVDQRIAGNGRLFDEDFFMYGDDIALGWRLRRSGVAAACVDQARVLHEGVGSSREGGFFYEYHIVRGHVLLAWKLARHRWEIPLLYCGRLLPILARAVVRAVRFRSLTPITASLCALRRTFPERL